VGGGVEQRKSEETRRKRELSCWCKRKGGSCILYQSLKCRKVSNARKERGSDHPPSFFLSMQTRLKCVRREFDEGEVKKGGSTQKGLAGGKSGTVLHHKGQRKEKFVMVYRKGSRTTLDRTLQEPRESRYGGTDWRGKEISTIARESQCLGE